MSLKIPIYSYIVQSTSLTIYFFNWTNSKIVFLSFFSFLTSLKIFKEPLNSNAFNERDFHPLIVTEKDYGAELEAT